MSKKLFMLITACVGGVATIATACITYFQPANATAWVASIGIIATAINEVLAQFVKDE